MATLLMVAWLPGLSRQDIGLQWRQAPASFRPALLVTLLLCGFSALLEWKQNACPVPALEQALYLLTFSGLSEEPFFRGLFPRLLSLTFSQSWRFLGIRLGWTEVLATTLFATTHSLCLVSGELSLSLWAFIVAGVQSIGFVWLRERTGSLVWPIIAHNTSKLIYTFL